MKEIFKEYGLTILSVMVFVSCTFSLWVNIRILKDKFKQNEIVEKQKDPGEKIKSEYSTKK